MDRIKGGSRWLISFSFRRIQELVNSDLGAGGEPSKRSSGDLTMIGNGKRVAMCPGLTSMMWLPRRLATSQPGCRKTFTTSRPLSIGSALM